MTRVLHHDACMLRVQKRQWHDPGRLYRCRRIAMHAFPWRYTSSRVQCDCCRFDGAVGYVLAEFVPVIQAVEESLSE